MGYTHFSKPCGVDGLYVGAKGSERSVVTTGNIPVTIMPVTTGAADVYVVAPVAGTVTGYAAYSVSAGTGRAVTVTVGSAGAILLDTGAVAANGTIGVPVTMTNSSGTTTITAGGSIGVHIASCATAQVAVTCMLTITPTA